MTQTLQDKPVLRGVSESAGIMNTTPTTRSLFWRVLQAYAQIHAKRLFQFKAYGLENIPKEGGVLLASNHQSYLDPVLIAVMLDRPVSFLTNAYLFKNPFVGWLIRSLHAFPVELGKGERGPINLCIEKLREGHILAIYPEGTRSPDGEIKKLQGGIALIARRAKAPVVPVVIDGAFEAWPRRNKVFHARPVHIIYGKPIDVSELDGGQIMHELEIALHRLQGELQAKRRQSGWEV